MRPRAGRFERYSRLAVLGTAALAVPLLAACNENPVGLAEAAAAREVVVETEVGASRAVDMLWVIDNSGSMCQEQKTLRENFEEFATELGEANVDFHIGVTTTDMAPKYPLEPVAIPGHLQSTPQPVPGFDRDCHQRIDENGERVPGDYTPLREALRVAVDCTEAESLDDYEWSNADIECALYDDPTGCSIPEAGCGGGQDPCEAADLFPDPATYRELPKVLRWRDYRNSDGSLQVERLKRDFACMSLVGTRGFGVEKGLAAAVEAVDPELTGGPADVDPAPGVDIDPTKPNHGLLRRDARFAVIFVTDENDCSDYASVLSDDVCAERLGEDACPAIDTSTQCRDDICDFANLERRGEQTPLIGPEAVKERLLANLTASKGREGDPVGEREVVVASIHGNADRYAGAEATEAQCSMPCTPGEEAACPDGMTCTDVGTAGEGRCEVPPTCATALGMAYSGDRYERFLRTFPDGNFFPQPNYMDPDGPLTGWMCSGDFAPALKSIGGFVHPPSGCITQTVLPCAGPGAACPSFPITGEAGTCAEFPNTNGEEFYCTSGLQVRARTPSSGDEEGLRRLAESGYCIPGSVGRTEFPNGCVIDRETYAFIPCPSGASGLKLEWADEIEVLDALGDVDVEIRYTIGGGDTGGVQ